MESKNRVVNRGVLLIGFNRLSLFKDRLKELENLVGSDIKIFISVDGPREGNQNDTAAIKDIQYEIENSSVSEFADIWFSEKNEGCDAHIFQSITKALLSCEYLAVIEDDIEITKDVVIEMLDVGENLPANLTLSPVIAMSGLFWRLPFVRTRWRETSYFSAWGYVIQRKFWEIHTIRVQSMNTHEDSIRLEHNPFWTKMPSRKKYIWGERMQRKNYDYAIQKTLFTYKIPTIAPVTRLINNVGHGIADASHTRFKTPWYLKSTAPQFRTEKKIYRTPIPKRIKPLIWLDSQTWAGDGLLSARGRTIGIRTTLRKIARKLN